MTTLAVFFPDARLTELGKIKVGGKGEARPTKSGGTFRLPEKYDHFVVTTMARTPKGDLATDESLMKQLLAKYGDPDGMLRQIPIRLLSNDIDHVMQAAFLWYGGKVLGARSDGIRVTWFNDRTNGNRLAGPIEEDWNPEFLKLANTQNQKLFHLHAVFNCVIAAAEAKWGGVYKFRTGSIISARQLYQSLLHLSQLTGGILMALPLWLVVRPVQVTPEGKPKTVYVVHVELRGPDLQQLQAQAVKIAEFQLAHQQRIQHLTAEYQKLLLPPGHESATEAADINEEFQPETVADVVAPPADPEWGKFLAGMGGEVVEGEAQEVEAPPAEEAPEPEPEPKPEAPAPPPDAEPMAAAQGDLDALAAKRDRLYGMARALAKGRPTAVAMREIAKKMGLTGITTVRDVEADELDGFMTKALELAGQRDVDVQAYLPGGPEYKAYPRS